MDKFKVGDRVRSKQPGYGYTGTITKIDSHLVTIQRDDEGIGWNCKIEGDRIATADGCWDKKHYLEHEGSPVKAELQVGDKVRILWDKAKGSYTQGSHYRDIGVIKSKDLGSRWRVGQFCKGDNGFNLGFEPDWLEKIHKTSSLLGTVTSSDLRLYKD